MSQLEKSILAVLVYFDLFDYPLSSFEIYRNLLKQIDDEFCVRKKISFVQLKDVLARSEYLREVIECRDGFFYLKGRESIIKTRRQKFQIAHYKYKKALRAAGWLCHVPFIRMIAVCNSLGFSNSHQGSDLDFFIIARQGHIWTVRLAAVVFLKILHARPTPKITKDKICLSFWVDDKNLAMEKFAKEPYDIYLYYWIKYLVPVWEDNGLYKNFFWKNFKFGKHLLCFAPNIPSSVRRVGGKLYFKKIFEFLGGGYWGKCGEQIAKIIQTKIMNDKVKVNGYDCREVVFNDGVLKFHFQDQRDNYRELFKKKYEKVMLKCKKD